MDILPNPLEFVEELSFLMSFGEEADVYLRLVALAKKRNETVSCRAYVNGITKGTLDEWILQLEHESPLNTLKPAIRTLLWATALNYCNESQMSKSCYCPYEPSVCVGQSKTTEQHGKN